MSRTCIENAKKMPRPWHENAKEMLRKRKDLYGNITISSTNIRSLQNTKKKL
jgi:hypothetical protein